MSQAFPAHWDVFSFSLAVKDATSEYSKLQKSEYLERGRFPIVDQGQQKFGGYTDDESVVSLDGGPVVVFGDHTRIFKFIDEPFCLGADGVKVLEPRVELDKRFLFYYLSSLNIVSAGYSRHFKFLKENVVPVPPLSEQKRIAAILDKADAIRRKRRQVIQLADDFLRATFLDMFGDPVANPKGWSFVELSTLVDPGDKLNYGVVQPGDDEEGGVPLVRSGDLSDVAPNVSQLRRVSASIDSKHRKSRLKGNEILIACVGTIGRVGWVSDAMIGWNVARAVTRIPIREGVNREYVYRYLQNPVVQGYFERETRAVAQPTLNVGLIAKTPVALPPHELQMAFLERYRYFQSYKNRLLKTLEAQERLAGSLSQKAFVGQL
ncbi:restriction endonuclease subunit S [Stenotrophomonas maltophilia]|uniref:restriction endonuclease subunit S n=1 Tax=Stenotrophomonas maltophilia TaxID=40324 RepID=UPI001D104324|nr:restriction endonuclease subunit S [Stenotrophomonas maltophilia]UXB37154.1 restriction endonuclease subunit S [Stenotrophomonas maltophilia]